VANDEDKAFLIGTLIIRIVEYLRLRARGSASGASDAEFRSTESGARAGESGAIQAAAETAGAGDETWTAGPDGAGESRPGAGDGDGGAAGESVAGLRHVIVIEEAHRLLRAARQGPSEHAVELFASLLAEIRAYGTGIIVAEQIPAKLVPDVIKNSALKILHRLPAADDRELVGATMNLSPDQSRQVVSMAPGVAAVFADGMDRPLRVRVPHGEHRERAAMTRAGWPPRCAPLAARRRAALRARLCHRAALHAGRASHRGPAGRRTR
jgi:hypothetical protein